MNLLFRLLLLTLWLKKDALDGQKSPHFKSPICRTYWVLPHDMGLRNHVPNYRYLSFIELNLMQWFSQQNTIEGAKWVIAAQQMTYIKSGRLFNKIHLSTQLLGWDEKYFYFYHEFLVRKKTIAVAMTKVAVMEGQEVVCTDYITDKPQQTHPAIETWLANQQVIKAMPPMH